MNSQQKIELLIRALFVSYSDTSSSLGLTEVFFEATTDDLMSWEKDKEFEKFKNETLSILNRIDKMR